MQRRVLIIVLAILGAVAVGTGVYAIVFGPAAEPGGAPTTASVDSEYRFVNVFWLAAGVILWWSLLRLSERRIVTRTLLVIAFAGGLARLASAILAGWPNPVFIASMILELVVVPLVIWWHTHVLDGSRQRKHE
jgi:hypothetical protein